MFKKAVLLQIIILLMIPLAGVSAQTAEPPYPCTDDGSNGIQCETPQDNECIEGGTMHPCTNIWSWIGGWLMARFNAGYFTRADIQLAGYGALLPPAPGPSGGTDSLAASPCVYQTTTSVFTLTSITSITTITVTTGSTGDCPLVTTTSTTSITTGP